MLDGKWRFSVEVSVPLRLDVGIDGDRNSSGFAEYFQSIVPTELRRRRWVTDAGQSEACSVSDAPSEERSLASHCSYTKESLVAP